MSRLVEEFLRESGTGDFMDSWFDRNMGDEIPRWKRSFADAVEKHEKEKEADPNGNHDVLNFEFDGRTA